MTDFDELVKRLESLPPAQRAALEKQVREGTRNVLWVPNPGPQTLAFNSEADELYYGGSAGGGKSDLLLGLALTKHKKSLLLRRMIDDARGLMNRAIEIVGHFDGLNRTTLEWRLKDRILDFGGCQMEDDKHRYKGRPRDLIGFDEGVDFTSSQYEFIKIWNRSTDPNQRCRVVVASNPPLTANGLWLIHKWAAWLDPRHPNPAAPGELRWYIRNDDDEEVEVDGPGPHMVRGQMVRAASRTFIPSSLEDNPDLVKTGYGDRLAQLPEELRAAYLSGKHDLSLKDHPKQVIPTAWIRAAMERWGKRPNIPMIAMGVDCSGGGADPMVIARRHDYWFDELITIPGKSLPAESLGKTMTGAIISHRRDCAIIIVDMGGGYGGAVYENLKENKIDVLAYRGGDASFHRTKDRQLGFRNKRSEAIWKFREALDPDQDGGSPICLPLDQTLLADLAAPTFEVGPKGIEVEQKETLVKRLGRSTDRGDAVIMAWSGGVNILQGVKMKAYNQKPQVLTKRDVRVFSSGRKAWR